MNARALTLIAMILVASWTRLIPHPWNFTAIAAMALFGGAHFSSRWQAYAVTFGSLLLTDLVLGFHSTMIWVYAAFALTIVIGQVFAKEGGVARVAGSALAASFLFFIITNFGVWASMDMYTKDLQGLSQCYIMALPFLQNQILGDLFYSGVLFGGYALLARKYPALKPA